MKPFFCDISFSYITYLQPIGNIICNVYIFTNKILLYSDDVQKQMQFCKRLPEVIVLGVKKCGTITLGKTKQNRIK